MRQSITYKFKDRLMQFLKAAHEVDDTIPETLGALTEQAGIYPIVSSGVQGQKGSMAVPYRPGLYVVGDVASVKNALLLLDGFFLREVRDEMAVKIYPHSGIDLDGMLQDCVFLLNYFEGCLS